MTNNQSSAPVAEPAELTWPSPDFLQTAVRKQREIDTAVRIEKDLAQRVASIQDQSFQKALPAALLVGGSDALKKLYAERDAATLAVNDKRAELLNFLNASRAGFFAARKRAQEQLHAVIAEQFAHAQKNATELLSILGGLLGTVVEAEREEKSIRMWNRAAKKFNRGIPAVNVNGIPGAVGIDAGESIRSIVHGMLLRDQGIRTLCREFFAREEERRARTAAFEEAKIDEAERLANPAAVVEPF